MRWKWDVIEGRESSDPIQNLFATMQVTPAGTVVSLDQAFLAGLFDA